MNLSASPRWCGLAGGRTFFFLLDRLIARHGLGFSLQRLSGQARRINEKTCSSGASGNDRSSDQEIQTTAISLDFIYRGDLYRLFVVQYANRAEVRSPCVIRCRVDTRFGRSNMMKPACL